VLPAADEEGEVKLEVLAWNGNKATSDAGLTYYTPEIFGSVGDNITLSEDCATVTRIQGVNWLVCMGAYPMRAVPEGRYFEVRVEDGCRNMRALALGVAVRPAHEEVLHRGKVRMLEARELQRSWLAGYDRGGALYVDDGAESKIPAAAWRPATCIKAGTRIGVLWAVPTDLSSSSSGPALVIFQDGIERVRFAASGRLPTGDEELVAVVDLQGSARSLTLLPGCSPPKPPIGWELVAEQM